MGKLVGDGASRAPAWLCAALRGGLPWLRRTPILLAALLAFAAPIDVYAQAKPKVSIHADHRSVQAEEARRSYTFTIKAVDGQGNA
ncbi:MAG: hypothetical protein OXI13_14350, partial [Gammaproteobacteria bacterium]|nr:hypothetical protein [Gammaproteobacteria bacterium]